MKYLTYKQAAEFCGFNSTSGLLLYIKSGVFPPPTIPQTSRAEPMLWSEDDVKVGFEAIKKMIDSRDIRAAAKRAITRREKASRQQVREVTPFDNAMRLMKVRA